MPIFEVQANGKTYEVEAPSLRAAITAVKRMGPSLGPMQPVPSHDVPERTWVDSVGDVMERAANTTEDFVLGGMGRAGIGKSLYGAAQLLSAPLPGPPLPDRPDLFDPRNAAESAGQFVEQSAEFLAPGGLVKRGVQAAATHGPRAARAARLALEGATAGSVASVQGASPGEAGATAALGAFIPGGGAVTRTQKFLERKSQDLVRAAIKPTVTAMQRVAGASIDGINAKASQLVNFIIENKVTTADKARQIVADAERELTQILAAKNAPTDAPQRAIRYLESLERSAAKQGLPVSDVATLRNAAAEVLQSGLGEDVVRMVPKPHPTLVSAQIGPNGKPVPLMVLMPETTRALRTDVMADEALTRARATSKWDTRKSWGEQKGAQTEASKTVERAERDAVKEAVPETRPVLKRQGQAIQTAKVLDRSEFRQANRDAVSLPAHVIAAGELASGRPPVVAFAANWLRDNQLKAGVWANGLAKAIERNDVSAVAAILKKIGVGVGSQAMRPVPSH